jgi:alpha-galactosidase
MVNEDSDVMRRHPDWLLAPPAHAVRTWRHQQVLDVANPEVADYLVERISAIVGEYGIDYVKWDQNRDLMEAVHAGRAGVDAHTRAVYAVIDEIRARHPHLEIESCASGGARVDLGILERTDRVWASDTNDPIERLAIQRWSELLLPLELIGSHVGPARAHTTGRVTDLGIRMSTALFGSAGIEWDITECSPEELVLLSSWITVYKRVRGLLHSGRLIHPEYADPGATLTGVIAQDRSHALYRLARTETGPHALPPALRLPGLDRSGRYRVSPVIGLPVPRGLDVTPPPWLARGELILPGSVLADVGVRVPLLAPAEAIMLEAQLVSSDPDGHYSITGPVDRVDA